MKRTPLKRGNKPLKKTRARGKEKRSEPIIDKQRLWALFLSLWLTRDHICQSCGKKFGDEPRSYYFDHLIEKSKRPDLAYDEENIFMCCLECHTLKTAGFPTEKHNEAIKNYLESLRKRSNFGLL